MRLTLGLGTLGCKSTLEAKVAAEGLVLTEAQVAALERKREDDAACGEIDTAHPGYLGSQDTFYVGTLKGVNRMRPVHPGEVLREDFLVPLGLSVNALAIALGVPATRIHEIVKERRSVTADTAARLARGNPLWWVGARSYTSRRGSGANSAALRLAMFS